MGTVKLKHPIIPSPKHKFWILIFTKLHTSKDWCRKGKKMKNIILLLCAVATYAAGSNAFSLTKNKPDSMLVVKEGGSFELNCDVDNYYEYCKFIHNGNICDFQWKREAWNITVADCTDYADRMVWSGNYDYYKCAITITDAKSDDAGTWSCEIESYA